MVFGDLDLVGYDMINRALGEEIMKKINLKEKVKLKGVMLFDLEDLYNRD